MSRERPIEPPRVVPDAERGVNAHIEARKERQRRDGEKLKSFSGVGFMGYLAATFSRGNLKRAPQFIRRGYEANIIDELRDFFARRPRPWRRRADSSCNSTFKERLKMRRRLGNA